MASITCEICGGKLTIQSGGQVAVCDNCGMEYSIDRVRELLANPCTPEKTVSNPAPQSDTHSQQVETYVNLARQAFETHRLDKALAYCDKIQEVNFNEYRAYLVRGDIEWRDTFRRKDAFSHYCKAILNTPSDKKDAVLESLFSKFKESPHDTLTSWPDLRKCLSKEEAEKYSKIIVEEEFRFYINLFNENDRQYRSSHMKTTYFLVLELDACNRYINQTIDVISSAFPGKEIIPVVEIVKKGYQKFHDLLNWSKSLPWDDRNGKTAADFLASDIGKSSLKNSLFSTEKPACICELLMQAGFIIIANRSSVL